MHHVNIRNKENFINLDDKVKAIHLCDGGKSCRAVAEEMGVGRTQIMNIL